MNTVLLGNIVALIGAAIMVSTGFLKTKKQKHIINKLRLATSHDVSTDIDATIRDFSLHRDMTFPAFHNSRSNIIQFDVFFCHLFL